jgi:hypothetical protein
MKLLLIPAVVAWLFAGGSASAQTVPSATLQEILIKTSLLTLSDAVLTGNYTVLHGKLSKPFRDQFSPERLKQVFKAFEDQKADFGIIAALPPIGTSETKITDGKLLLRGYFDTKPSRLTYELDFVLSEGEWKLININVRAKPPGG